jgi:alpha-D-ribose 1-methylphosphonate 5-triphosphate synthase subunit PhnH
MRAIAVPGFADPVTDCQITFRALMTAMASPGAVVEVAARLTPPAPLDIAGAALALTLLDAETRFWLPASCADARDWIRFHTGAAAVVNAGAADFAFVPSGAESPDYALLRRGTDEEPHLSATAICAVDMLLTNDGFRLTGPGIETDARLKPVGIPRALLAAHIANAETFPRGIDLVLTAGCKAVALPRTTRVEV